MVRMEGNICTYRYGEILHTSAALVGTIHVTQGIDTLGLVLERENKKSKENINISYQPRKIYGKIL